jgi:hypothetical protein
MSESERRPPIDEMHEGESGSESAERRPTLSPSRDSWREFVIEEVVRQRQEMGEWSEDLRAKIEGAVTAAAERLDGAEKAVADEASVRRHGITGQLNALVRNRFARYVVGATLMIETGAAAGFIKYEHEKEERQRQEQLERKEQERLAPPDIDVKELDPYATTERLQRLLAETMPKGWANTDVRTIGYRDEDKPLHQDYGLTGQHIAAEAGRPAGEAKTTIMFYRSAKGTAPTELWGSTLLHEVAHANDWVRDTQMTDEEKNSMREAVVARLGAADRYKSGYVESVNNKDAEKERETKALEYWADLSSAYLRSADPEKEISSEDRAIVIAMIKRTDPGFDQKAARLRREQIIKEMTDAKKADEERLVATVVVPKEKQRIADELAEWKLPADEKARFLEWFEAHTTKTDRTPLDPTQRREGRNELVAAMKHFGTTSGRREFIGIVIDRYQWRMQMANSYNDERFDHVTNHRKNYDASRQNAEKAIAGAASPAEFRLIRDVLSRIIEENDLMSPDVPGMSGASPNSETLEKGEYARLLDWRAGEKADWILGATRWEVPKEDDKTYYAVTRKLHPWITYNPH